MTTAAKSWFISFAHEGSEDGSLTPGFGNLSVHDIRPTPMTSGLIIKLQEEISKSHNLKGVVILHVQEIDPPS